MADNNENKTPDRLTFGQAAKDIWNLGKLGLIGTIATLFLREEQGREMIKNLANLTGHSLERIGIEGGPIAKDVEGWLTHNYRQLMNGIFRAVVVIAAVSALSLLGVAYIEWHWLRGLIGTLGIMVVIYVTHDLWVRWIPVTIGVGAAIGVIDAASAKSVSELMRNPFQVLFGGVKQAAGSVLWVVNFWKWMARVCIWYSVGVLYITLVPLHNTPGLIPLALPVIPLFFMIPLAEPWKERGTQYTWILWACLFWLINLALLAIFPDELYAPVVDGSLWARIIMVAVIALEASLAIKLTIRGQTTETSEVTSGRSREPRGRTWIESLMIGLGVFGVVGLGAGWLAKYSLNHTLMIPSNWMFDGNQTMNVILWLCIGAGVIALIIGYLASHNAKFK